MRRLFLWLLVIDACALASCGGGGGGTGTVYTVGGTVSGLSGGGLVLQNNGGNDLAVGANGPFAFATPLPAGSSYAVTVSHQPTDPTLNCVVMNVGRSGVIAAANVTSVTVKCAAIGRFGYVANAGSSSVSGFALDATTGALQPMPGSPFAISGGASSLTVDPLREFVFVPNVGVTAFTIDAASGKLVKAPGGISVLQNAPGGALTIDPSGRFAYAARDGGFQGPCCPQLPNAGSFSAYSIDRSSGALTELPDSPYAAGIGPSVTIDPLGRFLYVANAGSIHLGPGSGGVVVYPIDAASGAPVGSGVSLDAGYAPSVTFEPSGRFAYLGGGTQPYRIDGVTGALTPVTMQSSTPAPNANLSLIFEPSGTFAYGACSGGICEYSLDAATGVLTGLSTSPLKDSGYPSVLIAEPSGKFLYGLCGDGVCAFAIDSTSGALTAIAGGSYPLGAVPQALAFHPNGRYAYLGLAADRGQAGPSNGAMALSIDAATGVPTAIANTPLTVAGDLLSLAVDASGNSLYVAWSPAQPPAFPPPPVPGFISTYAIESGTGALQAPTASPVQTGVGPVSIAVEGSGRWVYVTNVFSVSLSSYAAASASSPLTELASSPVYVDNGVDGAYPQAIAIRPDGRFAYIAAPPAIAAFGIDAATGTLSAVAGSLFNSDADPFSIGIDATGSFAYVASASRGTVSGYTLDPGTGAMQALLGSPFPVIDAAADEITSMVLDPKNTYMFIGSQRQISSLAIDGAGSLTTAGAVAAPCFYRNSDALGRAVYGELGIDPLGRFVYATCPTGIWVYAIDPTNGTLALEPGSPYIPGTLDPVSIAVMN